jgi:pimeloyl-ACP methyl ester carboxylesterase
MLDQTSTEPMKMTLVFIHGAGGSTLSWQLQLHHFRDSVAIGLPGHPEGSGLRTVEEYTAWVVDYLRSKTVTDWVMVGHSMGGAIAIECALHALKLKGLVLVGTGARLRVRKEILSMILENYEQASKFISRMSVSPSCDPIVAERIGKEMLNVNAQVTYGDFVACDGFDRIADVQRVEAPTLVICGAEDQMTPTRYSQYLHEKIRNSKLVVIPGAGHSVMLEKHREFNEALDAFLSSL